MIAWKPEMQQSSQTRLPHSAILILLGLIAALLSIMFLQLSAVGEGDGSGVVVASFFSNMAVALILLVCDCCSKPFSIAQVHWLFVIVFFCVAPLSQFLNNYSCWDYPLTIEQYLTTNVLVFLWELLFALGYFLFRAKKSRCSSINKRKVDFTVSRKAVNAALCMSALCTLALLRLLGFANLFTRSTLLGLNQTSGLILNQLLRLIPVFCFLIIWIRWAQQRDCPIKLLLGTSLMLLAAFPFSLSRYSMAVIYGGLALIMLPLLKKKGSFALLFLFAFLILFPASNVFRAEDFSFAALGRGLSSAIGNLGKGFLTEDYDAYSMLFRSYSFIETYGTTSGFQLLGALLFFVPRAIWPSKPVGSGYTIAQTDGQTFLNVSCPLPGEGLVNFGLLGLLIFALLISAGARAMDSKYWNNDQLSNELQLIYPFICLFLFFIMRGDMLSSVSYLVGCVVSFLIVFSVARALSSSNGTGVNNEPA